MVMMVVLVASEGDFDSTDHCGIVNKNRNAVGGASGIIAEVWGLFRIVLVPFR